jgi:hypothetical protein
MNEEFVERLVIAESEIKGLKSRVDEVIKEVLSIEKTLTDILQVLNNIKVVGYTVAAVYVASQVGVPTLILRIIGIHQG